MHLAVGKEFMRRLLPLAAHIGQLFSYRFGDVFFSADDPVNGGQQLFGGAFFVDEP
jgi:hypothetical protein